MQVVYENLCPVCKNGLTLDEIERGLCLKKGERLFSESPEVTEFLKFFRKALALPKSIQVFWAKRILSGESFAAVVPTGIGKTTFGILMALFLAGKGKRSYIILPTTLLVEQAVEQISKFARKLNLNFELNEEGGIAYYHVKFKKGEKERFFHLLQKKDFKILITTSQFLSRHEIETGFDFIFVDDVDSVLKASKNVDKILKMLGFRKKKNSWEGKAKGSLMVSTATGKKGRKARLFRELLNFDIGSSFFTARNIQDILAKPEELETILKRMGPGGLIYAKDREECERIFSILRSKFRIGIVTSGKSLDYEKFERGELDFLIGTAYYYGLLVRGLDLPERIRYTVFLHCPVFRIKLEDLDRARESIIKLLAMVFREDERVKRFLPVKSVSGGLRRALKEVIKEGKSPEADIVVRKGEVIFPDIKTYIQGSGRCSRLFSGGITKGASFLLETEEDVLKAFLKRAGFYDLEFSWIENCDLEKLKMEIDKSRKMLAKREEFDVIKPVLLVVESPTKARQISRFFGKPSVKVIQNEDEMLVVYEVASEKYIFLITACLGHIVDMVTKKGYHGILTENGFTLIYGTIKKCRRCGYQFSDERTECPKCEGKDIDDAKRRINALRRLAGETGLVLIGTDPDREGEKIAWDLKNLLSGFAELKRIEFHEITKKAFLKAMENMRDVDQKMVDAQIVRRVEDRWIGFELTQKLWKRFKDANLSAGRAQTPVLGWIIQRAKESRKKKRFAFIPEWGLMLEGGKRFMRVSIGLEEEWIEKRKPLPPYTTDTLLKDASRLLKLGAEETMEIAQVLFENGLITYHRTDSTRVSEQGFRIAREYLGESFSPAYGSGEGAHECIRPTRPLDRLSLQRFIAEGLLQVEGLGKKHLSLYDLIFRRFMASQAGFYQAKTAKYRIEYEGREAVEERVLWAEGKAFELYRQVGLKKPLPLGSFRVRTEIKLVSEKPLFTQADVLGLMKERGIGRPSTYATLLQKLFLRGYIKTVYGKLLPTFKGIRVYSFLSRRYESFVSEERTRMLEEKMDRIEKGEQTLKETLSELYDEIRNLPP